MPRCSASTHGSQSILHLHSNGSASAADCSTAQASAPGMSSIHSGGTPRAAATTIPSLSRATNAQPFLARVPCGPSNLEPSVYMVPLKRPSAGRRTQWNVAPTRAEESYAGGEARGRTRTQHRPIHLLDGFGQASLGEQIWERSQSCEGHAHTRRHRFADPGRINPSLSGYWECG